MKREYGIDLLKMMAMIMVVTHHILNTGVETKVLENLGGGGVMHIYNAGVSFVLLLRG